MAEPANSIEIFDRARLRRIRNSRATQIDDARFLVDWAAGQLADRLDDIKRGFSSVLVSGLRVQNSFFTSPAFDGASVFKMDFAENLVGRHNDIRICADAEYLPFKENSFDLTISILDLHSLNDLPGALIQARRALKPDGLFLAAMLGGETLHELRQSLTQAEMDTRGGISPRILPFADKQQMGALMQRAGFALPVVDSDIVTVTYTSMFALLHDLRAMGEGNIIAERDKRYAGKKFFAGAAQYYNDNFPEEDGRIRASFEVIFLIGWAPHASQQKPLKPGSAQTRLADILGSCEEKL